MKSRRVMMTIELESDQGLKDLKEDIKSAIQDSGSDYQTSVIQIQANVIKNEKK